MPKPSRNDIYEAVISKMVTQALDAQELEFTRDHTFDSDEELIAYIRQQAALLRDTPRYKEIIGWKLISQRFGTWSTALEKAGLQAAPNCPVNKLPRIQLETAKQKEIYRQKKAEKKLRAQQRLKAQEEKRRESQKKKQQSI